MPTPEGDLLYVTLDDTVIVTHPPATKPPATKPPHYGKLPAEDVLIQFIY